MVAKRLEGVGKRSGKQDVSDVAGETLRVAVLIASTTKAYPSKFVECLSNMIIHFQHSDFNGEHSIKVFTTHGSILPEIRHRLIGDAISWDATHVLMLAPELTFPEDSIHRMLARGRGIVGVNYLADFATGRFAAYRKNSSIVPDARHPETEEVDGVALGMCLFNMPVFDILNIPFFEYQQIGETPAFHEDHIAFWEQVKMKKIPCVIDHLLSKEVKSLHHGELWH
jgi:hypothetical protein